MENTEKFAVTFSPPLNIPSHGGTASILVKGRYASVTISTGKGKMVAQGIYELKGDSTFVLQSGTAWQWPWWRIWLNWVLWSLSGRPRPELEVKIGAHVKPQTKETIH